MASQYEEDLLLSAVLPEGPGTYVDVGAHDPIEGNNTWALYQKGWHGICIEPLAEMANKLMQIRPRDKVLKMAVSNTSGLVDLRVDGPVSSLSPDWQNESTETRRVLVRTLSDILAAFPHIRDNCDLCSIDVEGHEKQVIEGIDFATFKPKFMIVESVEYKTYRASHHDWEHLLINNGYSYVIGTQLNRIYRRVAK